LEGWAESGGKDAQRGEKEDEEDLRFIHEFFED